MLPDDIGDYEENVTANVENAESGALLSESTAYRVIDKSLIAHSVGHSDDLGGYVMGSKPQEKGGKPYKAGQEDDDKEPESKLAKHIADALIDTLVYDEIGSEWCSQSNGLWRATTDKKALKIIMGKLDAGILYLRY
jgi:hypothetical protein